MSPDRPEFADWDPGLLVGEGVGKADTILTHDPENPFGAVVPPIFQTSLFTFSSFEEMQARFRGQTTRPVYTRGDNPTVQAFEAKLCALEGGAAARAVSSGMAAISGAVLSQVKAGDRVVCVRHIYPDAYRLFQILLPRFGVRVDYVDGTDLAAVEAALPGAAVLYLESPTSMTFETLDLAALANLARRFGAVSICDNSWATPLNQRPLALGVDIVVHSASKYISGHSDTVAGVIVSNAERMAEIGTRVYPLLGAKLAPMEAWLLLRGLRTLALRMRHHAQVALALTQRLRANPHVARVLMPDPTSSPGLDGVSGLFAFQVAIGVDIPTFCNALRLIKLGISWGGHESLVVPSAIAASMPAGQANSIQDFGVPHDLIRLSVGLEDIEDLWADLTRALAAGANEDRPEIGENGNHNRG